MSKRRNHDAGFKGMYLDNIFIERLWRSLKYECAYLHAVETGSQAKAGVGQWITFYNHQRPHAALRGLVQPDRYRPAGAVSSLRHPGHCPSDGE